MDKALAVCPDATKVVLLYDRCSQAKKGRLYERGEECKARPCRLNRGNPKIRKHSSRVNHKVVRSRSLILDEKA